MEKVMLKERSAQSIHRLVNSKEMFFMITEDLDSISIIRNRHHAEILTQKFNFELFVDNDKSTQETCNEMPMD